MTHWICARIAEDHAGLVVLVLLSIIGHGRTTKAAQRPRPTQDRYMNHAWRIDENHLIWWDDRPYVRYGFTGNGAVDGFLKLGFDQFSVCPSEELWVFSNDPSQRRQAVRELDRFTETLVKNGATYYAGLNVLWPWADTGKIAPKNRVACIVKHVWDLTESDRNDGQIELSFRTDSQIDLDPGKSRVLLFDMTRGTYADISRKLKTITTNRERIHESPSESYTAIRHTITLEQVALPRSHNVRVTLIASVQRETVPRVYPSSLPALWNPGIRRYYQEGLRRFRQAYAKEGLRGMLFGDEINTYPGSALESGIHVDFSHDAIATQAYRDWLKRRFKTIAGFNEFLGAEFREFKHVRWHICAYPFPERDEESPESERRFTFGLFDSFEQLDRIYQLQEEFRVWFYGYWLAEYGRMARETIGEVPVFVTSAGIPGTARNYLQIHKHAMLEGLDGLVRNHYAWVERSAGGRPATFVPESRTRFPLETVTDLLEEVQERSGRTKAYWANEFGRPRGGEDFVDDFGLGNQFSFPSKDELRAFLTVLVNNGYKGFNMFKMNPNVEAARQEVLWMAELKNEMVQKVVETTTFERPTVISRKQAVSLARAHPNLKSVLKRHPAARASAGFNDNFGVWIIEFIDDDEEIGFASVSPEGRVLEVDAKD